MFFKPLHNLSFWHTHHLPVLLQTEAAECGLVALCMISSYWGHAIDVPSMRRRFSVSMKGSTLKSLINMARGLGLQTRALKLDIQNLSELQLPCVLHWNLNHFVVLKSFKNKTVVIHDPAVGERIIKLSEFSKHFTGVALELTPSTEFKRQNETQQFTLLSLMGRVIGLKRGWLQLLLLGIALQICTLVAPFYTQWIVDEAILAADHNLVTVLGCGFLLLVLLQTSITAVRSWLTAVLAANLNFQWLGNAFVHLMRLPLPYFEKRHTGDVLSRFASIQTMQRILASQFVEGIIDGILVIGTFAMMLLYSTQLAILALIAVMLYVLLRWSIFKSQREATAEQIIHAAKQQSHFLESVRGVQSIRLFGRYEDRCSGWMNSLADQFNAELRISKLSVSYQTANSFLFGTERVIVIWLAALAVIDNKFSVGMLFAFISYKDQFSQRMSSLIDKLFDLRMLKLHGERVADIVLTSPEIDQQESEIPLEDIDPSIEIQNLYFRYSDSEPFILADFSLTIPAGQCIAITGASGCGKTTLIKLLLGLLEPTSGEILIGGHKLKQIGLNNYRRLLGTVMQDDQLFAGSIADNIAFFDPMPDQLNIVTCAQMTSIHKEISEMPMAYNTLVGDIGTGLSGGQKQRVLLARALYKKPQIIVLDEATSHLDLWNERAVNAAIQRIQLTRIIVAHRPETISMAERVLVLQKGGIIQDIFQETDDYQIQGTH